MVYSNSKTESIKVGACLIKGAFYSGEMYCVECLNDKHPKAV